MKIVNPFNYINPVTKEELFIGRESELKTIDYIFDLAESGSQYQNIAIIGDRAIGKTSLLNILLLRAQKRKFLAVCVDLNEELVSDSTKFFKEIIQAILFEGTRSFDLFGGKEKKGLFNKFVNIVEGADIKVEIPLIFGKICLARAQGKKTPEVSDTSLIHDFEFIKNEARKKNVNGILIAIDEANLLSKNRSILQKIRNVFQKLEGYILVLSGTRSLLDDLSDVFSPIQRFFVRVNLNPFSRDEIKDALHKPLHAIGGRIKVDPHIIPEIEKMSRGYPYEVNLIAHFAFKIATQKKLKTLMLTREVFQEIKNQKDQLIGFEQMFSALSRDEQQVLESIVFLDGEMSIIELARLSHDFDGPQITDSAVVRRCTQIHRPIFKRLEKKGFLTVVRMEGGKKIYGFKDRWLELYVKYTKVIPEAFEQYPRKHFHMLEKPSFFIMDKMLTWLTTKMEKEILVAFFARKRENGTWGSCCIYDDENPTGDKLGKFVVKSAKKLFKEREIDNAIPKFKNFLHESLPRKNKPQKLEILNRMIIDNYEMKVAFVIVKSQEKSKVQKVFEEAMNYIKRFWTVGGVAIH